MISRKKNLAYSKNYFRKGEKFVLCLIQIENFDSCIITTTFSLQKYVTIFCLIGFYHLKIESFIAKHH